MGNYVLSHIESSLQKKIFSLYILHEVKGLDAMWHNTMWRSTTWHDTTHDTGLGVPVVAFGRSFGSSGGTDGRCLGGFVWLMPTLRSYALISYVCPGRFFWCLSKNRGCSPCPTGIPTTRDFYVGISVSLQVSDSKCLLSSFISHSVNLFLSLASLS